MKSFYKKNKEIFNLHFVRIIAIYGIVLFHSSILLEQYTGISFLYFYSKALYSGVDFLFVLSGFLMYYLYSQYFKTNFAIVPFLIKRMKHIYPNYVFFTLCVAMVYFIFPALGEGYERNPLIIFKSLLFWPEIYPILTVSWMLSYQVYFYFLFSLLFSKRLQIIFFLVMGLSLMSYIFKYQVFWLNYFNLEFLIGMIAAFCFKKFSKMSGKYTLTIGFLFLAFAIVIDIVYDQFLENEKRILFYGLGGGFINWGLATIKLKVAPKLRTVVNFLSKISYIVFLSHYLILAFMFRFLFFFSAEYWFLKWIASLFFVIFGGICFFYMTERIKKLKFLDRLIWIGR